MGTVVRRAGARPYCRDGWLLTAVQVMASDHEITVETFLSLCGDVGPHPWLGKPSCFGQFSKPHILYLCIHVAPSCEGLRDFSEL